MLGRYSAAHGTSPSALPSVKNSTVTKAAARLHVSQPPLSRQIRDLEEELGIARSFIMAENPCGSPKLEKFFSLTRAVLERTAEAVVRNPFSRDKQFYRGCSTCEVKCFAPTPPTADELL